MGKLKYTAAYYLENNEEGSPEEIVIGGAYYTAKYSGTHQVDSLTWQWVFVSDEINYVAIGMYRLLSTDCSRPNTRIYELYLAGNVRDYEEENFKVTPNLTNSLKAVFKELMPLPHLTAAERREEHKKHVLAIRSQILDELKAKKRR